MSLECGQAIEVKDIMGTYVVRLIAQCGGRFLMISYRFDGRNGYMLPDWRAALRELIVLTVPRSLEYEKGMSVQSMAGGMYHQFPLTYPLSVKGLAELFGVDAGEAEALLKDLAVQAE